MQTSPTLLIVGGAEDQVGPMTILREFWSRAGGPAAVIGIVPVASKEPDLAITRYQPVWNRLGGARIVPLVPTTHRDAQSPHWGSLMNSCTAVFVTGGDQLRAADMVVGTRFHAALHDFSARGGLVAGTSAGAAILSRHMIYGGRSGEPVSDRAVEHREGLGLWPRAVIDQHFSSRARWPRLLAAIRAYPDYVGVGVDEDTAVLLDLPTETSTVIGSGTVTLVTSGSVRPDARLTLELDILRPGDSYAFPCSALLPQLLKGHSPHTA